MATGQSPARVDAVDTAAYNALLHGVHRVCARLCEAIVRDGEGATKLITIQVHGGATMAQSKRIASAVAHSPLCKTAFFASDANWGRILAAIGAADTALDIQQVHLSLNDVSVVVNGARALTYQESDGDRVMQQPEITVTIHLGSGNVSTQLLTTDLSHEYVRINAEYRT